MTRRKIILISTPLIILLFGICGFFYISSDSFLNNFIKPRLEKFLRKQVNEKYTVTVGKLNGNIFTGVEVENFRIEDKKSPILSTEEIVLKYNFFGLLQRKFLVTALEINAPEVTLQRNADGQVSLTQVLRKTLPEPESNNTFAFAVSNAVINGGKILFIDTQQNIELSLPNIDLELNGELDKWNHTGELSIGRGSFILNGTELPIEQLKDIGFCVSAKSSKLETLKLKLGNSFLEIQELNGNWDKRKWNTVVELTIDATDVQKFLGADTQLEGLAEFVLDLNGTDSTLNGTLIGTSEALSIKQIPTDSSESNIRQIDITELVIGTTLNLEEVPKVTLDKFSVQIADGTLAGSGSAIFDDTSQSNLIARLQHFVKQPVTYDSNWQISEIQLRSLLSMFGRLSEQTPQIESGVFSGTARINGKTTENFHLDSNVKLSETRLLIGEELIPTALNDSSLNFKISSEPENNSNVSADGNIDGTSVDISGTFESIDVKLGNVDFGKLSKVLNSLPFAGIGSITAQIKEDGTVTGNAEIPEAFYSHGNDPIPLGSLTGDFRYKDRVVYFENVHLTKQGGTSVSIEGDVGIDGKLPANFRIVADPLVLDADYNKLFFTVAYPIEGNMNGELNLEGFLIDHLDGKGKFSIDSGKAWGINLDPTTLPLEIDDYSLTIPNFEITTRGQQVFLNAHVTNEGEFDFSIKNSKGKPVQLAELARAADITNFPLDGKMEVKVVSHQKKQEDFVFQVEFDFSDLTFKNNPLGDANLDGTLIKKNKLTSEPEFFNFTGEAFEGTSNIEGKISNTKDSPYQFILKSGGINVSPILRILDRRLEAVSGTADSIVQIEGTLTELAESSKKRVYPYNVDITINETKLQYNSVHFTNPTPIRIKLEDDILMISESSLIVSGEKSPFVHLNAAFDAKSEKIHISAKPNENFALDPFGKAFGLPISGSASYELNTKGTLSNPIVELKWIVPTLVVDTDIGDISVRNANGGLTYQNNAVHIKPFTLQVLDNTLQVGGDIAVNQDEFNNSELNLEISGENLNLAKFSDLVKNSLSVETVKRLTLDKAALFEGNLEILLNVAGSIAQPVIDLNAHSTDNNPIKIGAFAKPITLEKLHALTTIKKQSVNIRDLIANGQVGKGSFQINGETSFSTRNKDEMAFDLGISVEKVEVGDFVTLYQQNPSFVSGLISGSTKLTGTGFSSDRIAVTCKIDELNLHTYNYQLSNTSPIDFKLNNNSVTSLFSLRIASPAIDTKVDVSLDGPLTTPNISAKWQGTLKHPLLQETDSPLQWVGNVGYTNKQIKLRSRLTNNGDNLTLNGTIPFDLTLERIDFSERFLDTPIDVRLTGKELPLSFFPSVDAVFSEAEGVADIDLKLQGTTHTPYLEGDVFFQAPHLRLNNFNQPFENVTVQLAARKDAIEFAKFQFDIEDGTCNLEQSELQLDGLTPKLFLVRGLSLKQYPLDSIPRQAISEDTLEEVSGRVTATLATLSIPLANFFENGEKIPIPKIREIITFDALTQEATADFTIDNITLGFTALDQQFSFENPEPIPITLDFGTFRVQGLKLENTVPIPSAVTEDPLVFSCFGRWNMRGEMSANLKLDNFNISILDPILPKEYREVYQEEGVLSTTIDITDTYAEPDVTVALVGRDLAINKAKIDEFSVELHYSYARQEWTISENEPILKIGKNQLTCSGKVPYLLSFSKLQAKPLSEEMEVTFDLQLDELGFLPDMEPLIQSASGKGSINATVSGTPKAPRLKGTGEFVELKLASSPVYFENTNAQFSFTESKLEITTFSGQLNKGDFSTTIGEINLDWFEIENINLEAILENCTFTEPGLYEINIKSGDLRLHGKITDLILEGDIKIDSGEYQQDWNWADVLNAFSAGTVREAELFSYAPILRELDLNVGIDIQNDFHLRSSTGGNTDIEIACSGQLTGAIQEPLFTGTVSLLGGEISIVTQIFKIVGDSTIRNISTTAFDPELNIFLEIKNPIPGVLLSDGSTADFKITATITGILENGDIDKTKISLQAEPLNSSTTEFFTDGDVLTLLSPGNSFSRSFGGFTVTISKGFDSDERHIVAEYPFFLFGRKIPIKVEGDGKDKYGVDVQLLEERF